MFCVVSVFGSVNSVVAPVTLGSSPSRFRVWFWVSWNKAIQDRFVMIRVMFQYPFSYAKPEQENPFIISNETSDWLLKRIKRIWLVNNKVSECQMSDLYRKTGLQTKARNGTCGAFFSLEVQKKEDHIYRSIHGFMTSGCRHVDFLLAKLTYSFLYRILIEVFTKEHHYNLFTCPSSSA